MDDDDLYGQAFSVPDLASLISRSQNPSKPVAERKSVRERKKVVATNIQTFETTMRKGKSGAGRHVASDSGNPGGARSKGAAQGLQQVAGAQPSSASKEHAAAEKPATQKAAVLRLKLPKSSPAPAPAPEEDVSALFDDGLYGDALRSVVETGQAPGKANGSSASRSGQGASSAVAPSSSRSAPPVGSGPKVTAVTSFGLPDLVPPPRTAAALGYTLAAGMGAGAGLSAASVSHRGTSSTHFASSRHVPSSVSFTARSAAGRDSHGHHGHGQAQDDSTAEMSMAALHPSAATAFSSFSGPSPSRPRGIARGQGGSIGYDPLAEFSALGGTSVHGSMLAPSSARYQAAAAEYSMFGAPSGHHSEGMEGLEYSMAGAGALRSSMAPDAAGSVPVSFGSPPRTTGRSFTSPNRRRQPFSPLVGSLVMERDSPQRPHAAGYVSVQENAGDLHANRAEAATAAVKPNAPARTSHATGTTTGSTPPPSGSANVIRLPGRIETSGQRKAGRGSPGGAVAASADGSGGVSKAVMLTAPAGVGSAQRASDGKNAGISGTGRGQAASANGSKHSKGSGKPTVGSAELPSHALHVTVLAAKKQQSKQKAGVAGRKRNDTATASGHESTDPTREAVGTPGSFSRGDARSSPSASQTAPSAALPPAVPQSLTHAADPVVTPSDLKGHVHATPVRRAVVPPIVPPVAPVAPPVLLADIQHNGFAARQRSTYDGRTKDDDEEEGDDEDGEDDDFELPSDDDDLWRDSGSDAGSDEDDDDDEATDAQDDDGTRTDGGVSGEDARTGSRSGVTSSDIAGGSKAGRPDTHAARLAAGSRSGRSHGTRSTRDTGGTGGTVDTGESGDGDRDGGSDLESIDRKELRDLMIDAHRPLQDLLDDMWRDESDPYFPGPGMGSSVLPAAGTGAGAGVRHGPGSPSTMSVSARSLGARSFGALSFGARSLGGRSVGGMSLGGMSVASLGGLTQYLGLPSTKASGSAAAGLPDGMEGGIDHSALSAVSSHAIELFGSAFEDGATSGPGGSRVFARQAGKQKPGSSPPRATRLSARAAARGAHLSSGPSQGASLVPDPKRPGAFLLTGWPGFEGREPPRLLFSEMRTNSTEVASSAQQDRKESKDDSDTEAEPEGLAARAAQRARARKAKHIHGSHHSSASQLDEELLHQPDAATIEAMLNQATVLQLPSGRAGSMDWPAVLPGVGPSLAWAVGDDDTGGNSSARQPRRKKEAGKHGREDESAVQARAMESLKIAAAQLGLSVTVEDYSNNMDSDHGAKKDSSTKRGKAHSRVKVDVSSAVEMEECTAATSSAQRSEATTYADNEDDEQCQRISAGGTNDGSDAKHELKKDITTVSAEDSGRPSATPGQSDAVSSSDGGAAGVVNTTSASSRPLRSSALRQEAIRAKVSAIKAKVTAAALAGQSARAAISKTAPSASIGSSSALAHGTSSNLGSSAVVPLASIEPTVAKNPAQAAEAIEQLLQAGPWLLQGTANTGIEGCTVYDVNRSSGKLCLVLELSRIRTEEDGYKDGLKFSGTTDGTVYTPLPGPAAALQAISVGSKHQATAAYVNMDGDIVDGLPPLSMGGSTSTDVDMLDSGPSYGVSSGMGMSTITLQREGPLCRVVPCWERPTWAHLLHARLPSVIHLSPFALAWDRSPPTASAILTAPNSGSGMGATADAAESAELGDVHEVHGHSTEGPHNNTEGQAPAPHMALYPSMSDALALLHPQPVRLLHPAAMPAAPAHYAYFTHTQYKTLLAQVQQLTSLLLSALVHATNPEPGKGDSESASKLVTMLLELLSLRQAAEQLRAKDTAGKVEDEEPGQASEGVKGGSLTSERTGSGSHGTKLDGSLPTSSDPSSRAAPVHGPSGTGVGRAALGGGQVQSEAGQVYMPFPAVPMPPPSIRNGRVTRLALSTAQKAFLQYGSWSLASIPTDEASLLPPSVFQAPMLADATTGRILASVLQWQALHARVKDSMVQSLVHAQSEGQQGEDAGSEGGEGGTNAQQPAELTNDDAADNQQAASVENDDREGGKGVDVPDHEESAPASAGIKRKHSKISEEGTGHVPERLLRPKRQRKPTARLTDDGDGEEKAKQSTRAGAVSGANAEKADPHGLRHHSLSLHPVAVVDHDHQSHLLEALAPLAGSRLQALELQSEGGKAALKPLGAAQVSGSAKSFGSPARPAQTRTREGGGGGSLLLPETSMTGYGLGLPSIASFPGVAGSPSRLGSTTHRHHPPLGSEYSLLGAGWGAIGPMGTMGPPPSVPGATGAMGGDDFDLLADLYSSYMLPSTGHASTHASSSFVHGGASVDPVLQTLDRSDHEGSLVGIPNIEGRREESSFGSPARRKREPQHQDGLPDNNPATSFGMPTSFGSPPRPVARSASGGGHVAVVGSEAPAIQNAAREADEVDADQAAAVGSAVATTLPPLLPSSAATSRAQSRLDSKGVGSKGKSSMTRAMEGTGKGGHLHQSVKALTDAHEARLHMIYASAGNLLLSEIQRMGSACGVPMVFTLPSITLPGTAGQQGATSGSAGMGRKAGDDEMESNAFSGAGGAGTGGTGGAPTAIRFMPEEDILIFLGLLKYGPRDINMIRARLLPNKTYAQIQARIRNLCTRRKFRPVTFSYKLLSSIRKIVGAPALLQPSAPPVLSNTAAKCTSSELYIGLEGASTSQQNETLSCLPALCQGYSFTPDQQASAMVELALQVGTGRLVHEAEHCLTAGAVLPFDFSAGERALLKAACDVYGVSTRSFQFMSQAILPHRGPELIRIFYAQYVMERAMENLLAPNMNKLSAALASVLALGPLPSTAPGGSRGTPSRGHEQHEQEDDASMYTASGLGGDAPERAPKNDEQLHMQQHAESDPSADSGLIGLHTLADANNAVLLSDIFGAAAAAAAASERGSTQVDEGDEDETRKDLEAGPEDAGEQQDDGSVVEDEDGQTGSRLRKRGEVAAITESSDWAVDASSSTTSARAKNRHHEGARDRPRRNTAYVPGSAGSTAQATGVSPVRTANSSKGKQAAVDPFALIDDTTMLCRSMFPELRWIPGDGAYRGPQRPHMVTENKAVAAGSFAKPLPSYLCMVLAGLAPRPEDAFTETSSSCTSAPTIPQAELYMPHVPSQGTGPGTGARVFIHRPQPGQETAGGLDALNLAASTSHDGVMGVGTSPLRSPSRSRPAQARATGASMSKSSPARHGHPRGGRAGSTPPRARSTANDAAQGLGMGLVGVGMGMGLGGLVAVAASGHKGRMVRWHDQVQQGDEDVPVSGAAEDGSTRQPEEDAYSDVPSARGSARGEGGGGGQGAVEGAEMDGTAAGSGLPYLGSGSGASSWQGQMEDGGVSNRQSELLRSLLALASAPPVAPAVAQRHEET